MVDISTKMQRSPSHTHFLIIIIALFFSSFFSFDCRCPSLTAHLSVGLSSTVLCPLILRSIFSSAVEEKLSISRAGKAPSSTFSTFYLHPSISSLLSFLFILTLSIVIISYFIMMFIYKVLSSLLL